MTKREHQLIKKLIHYQRSASRWRRIAKLAQMHFATLRFFSTRLMDDLGKYKDVPVISDLYRMALRWDCRVGDYQAEVDRDIAAAKLRSRRADPPDAIGLPA